MTELSPIDHLTIDDNTYNVAELPQEVQGAVKKYEEWRDRYIVAQDEVQLVSAALRDLGSQIVAAVRATETATEPAVRVESVETETPVEPDPALPTGDTLVVEDAS